jgi:hypothetical protein
MKMGLKINSNALKNNQKKSPKKVEWKQMPEDELPFVF